MNSDKLPVNLEELDGKEIWSALYNKELNTKKNILEYIEITKVLKQDNVTKDKIQQAYTYVYNCIEELGGTIKVNTKMYLKNALKAQLGKYVLEMDPMPKNYFIEFFKKAYPENKRRKDFTWVITDINKIVDEQIWTTLTYINGWLSRDDNELDENQKNDIIKMLELLVNRGNIKYINNTKSLENLLVSLNIRIVNFKSGFKIVKR